MEPAKNPQNTTTPTPQPAAKPVTPANSEIDAFGSMNAPHMDQPVTEKNQKASGNKTLMIVSILVALLVVGGVVYWFFIKK